MATAPCRPALDFPVALKNIIRIVLFTVCFIATLTARAELVDSGLAYGDSRVNFARPACGVIDGSWHLAQTNGTTAVLSPAGYSTPMWDLRLFSAGNDYGDQGVRSSDGIRMVGTADIPINDQTLDAWRQTLANARANGAFVSPRFAYDCNGVGGCEPAFDMVLFHMRQIAAVLNEYADVVPSIECGIIGAFGEMHTSPYCGAEYANRVLRTWLAELDPRIQLQIRSSSYLFRLFNEEILGRTSGNVHGTNVLARLTELSDWSRIGLYNDGYLGTVYDYGTWTDGRGINNFSRSQGNLWLSLLPHIPYGGELAGISEEWSYAEPPFVAANLVTNGFNQVEEWYRVHLSYLRGLPSSNKTVQRLAELPFSTAPFGFDGMETCGLVGRPFFEAMITNHIGFGFDGMPDLHEWVGEPLSEFLRAHIGHRFILRGSRLSSGAAPGGTLALAFDIENTGFSDLALPTATEILLHRAGAPSFWACPVTLDLGASVPSTSNATFSVSLHLPATLPEGSWNVCLRTHVVTENGLPSSAGLGTVRFANAPAQWNDSLSANLLGTVPVSGAPMDDDPEFHESSSALSGDSAPRILLSAVPSDAPLEVPLSDWSGAPLCVHAPGFRDIRYLHNGEPVSSTNGVVILPDGDAAAGLWSALIDQGDSTLVRDILFVVEDTAIGHTWRLETRNGVLRAVCSDCGVERDPTPSHDRAIAGRLVTSLPSTNAVLTFVAAANTFSPSPASPTLYPAFAVENIPEGGARLGNIFTITAPPDSTSYIWSNSSGNLRDPSSQPEEAVKQSVDLPADGAYLTDIAFSLVNWSSPSRFGTVRTFALNSPDSTRGGRSAGLDNALLSTLGILTTNAGYHVWFCDTDWTVLCETNAILTQGFNGNFHTIPIPAVTNLFVGEAPPAFLSTETRCRPLRGWKRIDGTAPGWALGDIALLPDYADTDHTWETAETDAHGDATVLRCSVCGVTRTLPTVAHWFDVRFESQGYRFGTDWDAAITDRGSWRRPAGDTSVLVPAPDTAPRGFPVLSVNASGSALTYVPETASSNRVNFVVEGRTAVHSLASAALLPAAPSGGIAFVLPSASSSTAVPYGHSADGWVSLLDASPSIGSWVTWSMELNLAASTPLVRYSLDGSILSSASGDEWLPLPSDVTNVSAVSFLGTGFIGDFRGTHTNTPAAMPVPVRPVFTDAADAPALSFAVDPDTGDPILVAHVSNAVAGVYYTVFVSEALDAPFVAEGDSLSAPVDGALALSVDATAPAKFVIVTASDSFIPDGTRLDEL